MPSSPHSKPTTRHSGGASLPLTVLLHSLIAVALLFGGAAPAQARPTFAPQPSVSLSAPSEVFLGQNFNLQVTFDNSGPDTGYGPFVDLIFPVNGQDGAAGTQSPDGIDFNSATYLGVAVTSQELTFPDDDGAGAGTTGCVDHPYARDINGDPLQVCGTAGDKLVVLLLPFGSFTPSQPPAQIDVNATLSGDADVGSPLTIRARGGFQFGATPLDDWCCDPVIVDPTTNDGSGWPSTSVTPTLLTLSKTNDAPESETATGPNFPRSYRVEVSIAAGQTISPLEVVDELPNNVAFVSVSNISAGGSVTQAPATGVASNPPDNEVIVEFSGASGTVGFDVNFFVPEDDADGNPVIDPSSGDDVTSENQVSASGPWTPTDGRDDTTTVTTDPVGPEDTLADRSIAVQKSVAIVNDVAASGLSPGDTLEYTLNFQVSDFFTFGDLVVTDMFSDGQRFDTGFAPTYDVDERGANFSGTFTSGADLTVDESEIGGGDGSTTLTFDVSQALTNDGAPDGILVGGRAVSPDAGPAQGTIRFRTVVQDEFSDTFPSGDASVDQGDVLSNDVVIDGSVRDNDTPTTVLGNEADTSAASTSIPRGVLTKSIYALNGSTSLGSPVQVKPGDEVTYRLQYTLPTSDVEDLVLTDFLPLPIYDATELTTFDSGAAGTIPPAGTATFGPADTFFAYSGLTPTLSTSASGNSVTFEYGDFDDTRDQATQIDLLLSVTVTAEPFADGLFLTNEALAQEGSTNAGSQSEQAIVQVQVQEPLLVMTKGVIATSNPEGDFAPATTGPVSFSAPGSPGVRFASTINSDGLASDPVDSNLSDVDADDLVSFAIVIENQGSGPNGAFDIQLQDELPPGFVIPGGGGNLSVTRGDGTSISIVEPGTSNPADINDLFGAGIELVDPSSSEGACQVYDPSNGQNIIVITYDLQLDSDVGPEQEITNTATVTNYASEEGGPDFTGSADLTDDATVTVASPAVDKTFVTTNQSHTSDRDVAIGEQVEYQIVVTVPEGELSEAELVDDLDLGLAFVSVDSITASADLSTSVGSFADVLSGATFSPIPSGSSDAEDQARRLTLDFGTLTNSNTDNSAAETITIETTVVVINNGGNNRGNNRNNDAQWNWVVDSGGQSVSDSAQNVTIVEPELQVVKSASPTTADAGDTVTFTLTVSHAGASDADAFELALEDVLPSGLSYVPGSVTNSAGEAPDTLTESAGTISATWSDLLLGETSELQFQATLDSTVSPGEVITNTGEVLWTSLPGDVTAPQTANNALSVERTGDTTDAGGSANDYLTAGSADVTVFSAPEKFIVATSEAHTTTVSGTERAAIGEIVRFRLVFRLAEGTATNFQLRDRLPAGLRFLNDGTAMAALVADDVGITSSTLSPGPEETGDESSVAGITPSFVLPDSAVSASASSNNDSYGSGTDVYFKFGDLTNDDRDENEEFVVVEFNALVENVSGNQAYNNANGTGTATQLSNDFQVLVDGSVVGTSSQIRVRVAEPLLNNLSKTATTTPSDAGDTVVFGLSFSNTATGVDGAAAFEVQLTDTLDSDLTLDSVSISAPSYATVTDNSSAPTVDVSVSRLDPGDSVTVTVTATVVDDAAMGSTIPNNAALSYTSLPGASGTTSNGTGSSTPGAASTATGERTGSDGSGGLNDFVDSADLDLQLSDPALAKSISATSVGATGSGELDPTIVDLVIGEEVTFEITATLSEGDATVTLVDNLPTIPDGVLSVVSSRVVSIGGQISGSALAVNESGVHADSDTDGFDDQVTFAFGALHNEPDGVSDSGDQLVVEIVALVENVSENQNGDELTNTAELDFEGDDTVTATAEVEIVEPEPEISKAADDDTPALGQIVTYTITIDHPGASTADAHDLVITDTIPSGMTYVTDSASLPDAQVDESSAPTIVFTIPSLSLTDGSTSFTYQATVDSPPSANVGDVFTNTPALTWSSIAGADDGERTGEGGVDDYSDSTSEQVTVTGIDLVISKDDGGATAQPGDTISYTLEYENVGNTAATGIVITDVVPANTTFLPGSSTGGWSCSPDNNAGSTCTLSISSLGAGAAGTATFAVQLVDPAPAALEQIDNTAEITDDGSNGPEPTPDNNSDDDFTPVGAVPDLVLDKDDGLTIISQGTTLRYEIVVENVGDQDATGVEISDTVPDDTTFDASGSSSGWSCTPDNSPGSSCSYTVGDLDAGDSVTVIFQVQVDDPLTAGVDRIENEATVADDGDNGPDPTPENNTDDDVDRIAADVNTDLDKDLTGTDQTFTSGSEAAIGEIITYEITIDVPPGTMVSAVLSDTLDRGLALVECVDITASSGDLVSSAGSFADICDNPTVTTAPSGSSNPADPGRGIEFDLGNLSNSGSEVETLTITYTAAVLDSAENERGLSLNNSASLVWGSGDLSGSADTITLVEPDLSLAKTVAPNVVPPNSLVTFTLVIEHTSASDADAFDLVVGDELPPQLVYEPGTLIWTGGVSPTVINDADPTSLLLGWDELALGETSEIQYQARLTGVGPGGSASNDAFLEWSSLPGDVSEPNSEHNDLSTERLYDPGSLIDVYGVGASADVRVPQLPATGFAPGRRSVLGPKPTDSGLAAIAGMQLDINSIGVSVPVVGVPTDDVGWDLTWLGGSAGYLEGTAFPTLPGNTALTAHVYLADGTPGPFYRLHELRWGDRIEIAIGEARYVYEVRQVHSVLPRNLSVLRHEERDWLTLITCEDYDEASDSYRRRLAVRAVLMSIEAR